MINNPGCFGVPMAVHASSPSCRACAHSSGCLTTAASFLEQLPDNQTTRRERQAIALTRIGLVGAFPSAGEGLPSPVVTESSRGLRRVSLTPAQDQIVSTFPVRIAKPLRQMLERGWFDFAKVEIANGRNPADKGWKKVLCGFLLAGGVTRDDLILAFVEQLKLTAASANTQASVGIALFVAGHLASERFGKILFNPN